MDRQELTKHATEWIKQDTMNRSMIFIASDCESGQIKESVTVGGTIEAMTITLVDVMSQNLRFAEAVMKAAKRYEEDNKKWGLR